MSELEQDFDKTVEQINAKLKEAAAAVREANELAAKAGLDGLIFTQFDRDDIRQSNRYADEPLDKYALEEKIEAEEQKYEAIKVRDLESALGSAGWSTSSSYC
jgi:hypothetical protein